MMEGCFAFKGAYQISTMEHRVISEGRQFRYLFSRHLKMKILRCDRDNPDHCVVSFILAQSKYNTM